jgi:hypothetical protein
MNTNPHNNPEEIDIIQFFLAIGNMFKRMGNSIANLFKRLFYLILDILLYLKKHYVYLTAGLILGLIVSFFVADKQQLYYGKTLLRANYDSQIALNEKVNLVNDLIQKNDTINLGRLLDIPSEQAAKLFAFVIEPVYNDVYLIDDYEDFLTLKDTVVYKFIKYKDYKANIKSNESLNKYWLLTIKTTTPEAFNQLNNKILALFNNDETLKKRKENYLTALSLRQKKDIKSLQDIDSMRQIFNKVMIDLAKNKSNGAANIVVSSDRVRGPEASYNLFFERKKILKDIEVVSQKLNKYDDVIVMYNTLPQMGIKMEHLIGNKHVKYALGGFIIILVLLIFKDFNMYLKVYEQRKKASGKS